jgi:hypothetical protein
MAENSLEKKIKKVLEERSTLPSEHAWKAIENELGSGVEAGNTWKWKYGIAAGFIGALLITIFLINREGTDSVPAIEVVKSAEELNQGPSPDPLLENNQNQQNIELAAEAAGSQITDGQTDKTTMPKEEELAFEIDIPEEIVEVNTESVVPMEGVNQKVAEIIAQVAIIESTGEAVKDEVIDSLLRSAQQQLFKEQMGLPPASVDALALLSDVENELNRSLRDQLFDKLKDGYLKVRTTIAYRND